MLQGGLVSPGSQGGAGQDRQGEDVKVIGVQPQGEVQAVPETGQGITRQTVHQVEAEHGAAVVQQHGAPGEVLPPEGPPDLSQHQRVGALQPDLQGTGDCSEEFGHLPVDELAAHLEVEVDLRGDFTDQPQDLLGPARVLVEGRVQHEDLADPVGGKVAQFSLDAARGEAPHTVAVAGVEAEITGETAAPRQLPED